MQEGPSPKTRLKRFVYQHVEMGEINSSFFVCKIFLLLPRMKNEDKANTIQIQYGNWEIGKLGIIIVLVIKWPLFNRWMKN